MKFLRPFLLLATASSWTAGAAPPYRYDHVVIVIEENESQTRIMGNRVDAPYINELADGGVNFTQFYAITHPSEPNYLHLFSGDNQGVLDDGVAPNQPFGTPNLGAALLTGGISFAGYCEDLPAIGDTTTNATFDNTNGVFRVLYVRKHNPWVNWQAPLGAPSIPLHQLPAETNLRFSDFPTDFSLLPAVSFVVPNQQNDMHDGTIRMADDWLRANLGAYARWARTHNSLLVVTFDEDDFLGPNLIPTVMFGAGLTPGTINSSTWTLHHLLRTLSESYHSTPPARAALVRRIHGVLPKDPPVLTTRFQRGLDGYSECVDTILNASSPAADGSALTALYVSSTSLQTLLRFNDLVGSSPGQIPANATVLSAKLILWTSNPSFNAVEVHRMLVPWDAGASWNSLQNGVSADDLEAVAAPTFSLPPTLGNAPMIFDVTSDVEAWLAGAANRGWALLGTGSDLWITNSSEFGTVEQRPVLEVSYTLPVNPGYPAWQLGAFGVRAGKPGTLREDDPDHDGLANIVEYAINTSPQLSTKEGLPTLQFGDGTHHFTFARNLSATDVSIEVQANSGNGVATWTTVATWTPGAGWSAIDGFTVTDYAGAVEITEAQNQSRFFRLRVTAL